MDEIRSEEQVSQEASRRTSHEPFFGVLVMMMSIVLLGLLASYGGWFLYHGVKRIGDDTTLPSIETIPLATDRIDDEQKAEESKPIENAEAPSEEMSASKKIAVTVLNGGAVKGTASVVAGVLMGSGYSAVSSGNSKGDYTGVTVFFTEPATEMDAAAIRKVLLAKYPSMSVKPSVASMADTLVSPITIIVGK